jgi:hypothetical protein
MDEEIDTLAILQEFTTACTCMSPEQRARAIIKSFLEIDEPDEQTRHNFHRWLLNGHDEDLKHVILEEAMMENIAGKPAPIR